MKKRFSLLFIILITIALSSCSKKTFPIADKSRFIFENQSDGISYFIRIDTVFSDSIKGRYYEITQEPVLQPDFFKGFFAKRHYYVTTKDQEFSFKLNESFGRYKTTGKFKIEGQRGKSRYTLTPYEDPIFETFDDRRYREETFEVEVIPDITYANVKGFWDSHPDDSLDVREVIKDGLLHTFSKRDIDLKLDVYLPKGDTLAKRPLMLFFHGGAFYIGDKADESFRDWASHFAKMGYVAVSANYRMGFRVSANSIERTGYQAAQDAHAAMRFLVTNQETYGIDTSLLFAGGTSAGSINTLNLAFMRNNTRPESSYRIGLSPDLGNIDESGNDLKADFHLKAIANMWGTVFDTKILENSKTSIISFHGDQDDILPYKYDFPFSSIGTFKKVLFNKMYGSYCIHEKAKEIGLRSKLITYEGRGHALQVDEYNHLSPEFYQIQDSITTFFYDEIFPNKVIICQSSEDPQIYLVNGTDVKDIFWSIEGGIFIRVNGTTVRAAWLKDEATKKMVTSGKYKNGLGFYDTYFYKN